MCIRDRQEDIDSVLTRGSGFQDGKYRIYRQFQKYDDSKSNIAFLKKEYGIGGGTHLYPDGTKGGEWHDGKGIGIGKHGSYTNPDLRLSWSKVEKRLRELIKANRYLNPKEKAKLPTHTLIKDFDGLDKNSIILFEQIRTIDKQRLREYLGTLDRRFIHCADKALAISIGLAKKD